MGITLPVTGKTIFAEATVEEEGVLRLKDVPDATFKSGDKVLLTISPKAENTEADPPSLVGTVIRYEDPFGPATSPEDWEALR